MPFSTKLLSNTGTHLTKMINPYVNLSSKDMSIYLVYKPKKAPSFATDNSGKHFSYTTTTCDEQDCETKVCRSLCGNVVKMINKGHFTHKPQFEAAKILSEANTDNTLLLLKCPIIPNIHYLTEYF